MSKTLIGKGERAFHAAVLAGQPGDSFVYHIGSTADGPLCGIARRLADKGLIELVQRRVAFTGVGRFQYEAQRTRQKAGK